MSVTEIVQVTVSPTKTLPDLNTEAGTLWANILTLISQSQGYQHHTWGRGFETPATVRLHIMRDSLEQHSAFHQSPEGITFAASLSQLSEPDSEIEIKHAVLENIAGDALTAPLTGTALYLSTEDIFTDLVWPLWTHIVRQVSGFKGITSGRILDHKSGRDAFLVYVGWENLEVHRAYWEDPGLDDKRGILDMGNQGRTEFYHLVFNK